MNVKARSEAAIEALINAPKAGIKLSLDHLSEFFAEIGNPHHNLPPIIHVAGTNGKGSTIAFLRAIYVAAGLRVHAYTSPHLVSFHERIMLAGEPITDALLLELIDAVQPALKKHPVTFFEAATAIAFLAFQRVQADVLLLEVGMGGRLDTTNIVPKKIASVITPIGMDHAEFLGDSIEKIAAEKAGIMAANTPAFFAPQDSSAKAVLDAKAQAVGARVRPWALEAQPSGMLLRCDDTEMLLPRPNLYGAHQMQNAALAAATAWHLRSALPIGVAHVQAGITNAQWRARIQLITHGPLVDAWAGKGAVFLDGAHNTQAAQALAQAMAAHGPITLICGMMQRKDVAAYLDALAPITKHFIAVNIEGMESQCMQADTLAQHAARAGIAHIDSAEQLDDVPPLLANCATETLLVAGSLYLAGNLLKNHR